MDRLHQPAARHGQPEAVLQQRGDFPVGQAEAFIEEHGEGDRLRPQLHGGGAERVGGLQRMATLDAPMAVGARADVRRGRRARAGAAPGALLDTASPRAGAARRADSADTAAAAAPRRSRRCASGLADARGAHTRAPLFGPAAAAAPRACRGRTGRPGGTRRGAPPRGPLSVSRSRAAAAVAPLPIVADPRGAARSHGAAPR